MEKEEGKSISFVLLLIFKYKGHEELSWIKGSPLSS